MSGLMSCCFKSGTVAKSYSPVKERKYKFSS